MVRVLFRMVLGFSSGPIRIVFMLFYPLMAKVINFLRNGSGPIRMVFMLFYPLMAKVINFLDFAGRVSFSFRWHFLS